MKIRLKTFIAGLLTVLCVSLLCPVSFLPTAAHAAQAPPERYVITLKSSMKPIDISSIPRLEAFSIYRLYIKRDKKGKKGRYNLRLGFFLDLSSAKKVRGALRGVFSDASTSKVSMEEIMLSSGLQVNWPDKAQKGHKKAVKAKYLEKAPARGARKKVKALMDEASRAMTGGKNRRAIEIYKRVLGISGHKHRKSAQEFLGLARERSGDIKKARAEYMAYLIEYPKGEDSERVRQRLSALETARDKPKKRLRKAKKVEKNSTEIYGSFSQFYHREDSYTDLGGNEINRSSLSNDMDFTIRQKKGNFEYTTVFIVGYEQDFLNGGADNRTYLSRAYFDLLDRTKQFSLRLGRQSSSSGGVLGRFDGAHFSYQIASQVKLNLVAGYPVNSAVFESFNTDKHFYGVSLDLGTFFDYWDYNVFYIRQTAQGVFDREAVGVETRYFHRDRSLFMLIDFDTSYHVLNTLLISGNMKLSKITTINTFLDLRRSPILTTSNALQGQMVTSLDDLILTYTEDQIRSLAFDRTAESRSLLVGVTRVLNEKVQISGDFTVSELKGTPASGGVEAMPGTGYEYFISSQLVGSSLVKMGDTAILGFRYSNTASSERVTVDVNTRYPISRKWRVNPRLRIDYSWQLNNSANYLKIRPSFRSDYYWKKNLKLEFDGGVEWGNELTSGPGNDIRNYFVTFGYRKNF